MEQQISFFHLRSLVFRPRNKSKPTHGGGEHNKRINRLWNGVNNRWKYTNCQQQAEEKSHGKTFSFGTFFFIFFLSFFFISHTQYTHIFFFSNRYANEIYLWLLIANFHHVHARISLSRAAVSPRPNRFESNGNKTVAVFEGRRKVFFSSSFDEQFYYSTGFLAMFSFQALSIFRHQTWKFHHSLLWAFIIEFIGSPYCAAAVCLKCLDSRFQGWHSSFSRWFVPPVGGGKRGGRKNVNISEKIFFLVALKFPYLIVILICPTIVTRRRFTSEQAMTFVGS